MSCLCDHKLPYLSGKFFSLIWEKFAFSNSGVLKNVMFILIVSFARSFTTVSLANNIRIDLTVIAIAMPMQNKPKRCWNRCWRMERQWIVQRARYSSLILRISKGFWMSCFYLAYRSSWWRNGDVIGWNVPCVRLKSAGLPVVLVGVLVGKVIHRPVADVVLIMSSAIQSVITAIRFLKLIWKMSALHLR